MGLGVRYKTRCDGCGAPMFVKRQDTYVNAKGEVCFRADASVCKKCLYREAEEDARPSAKANPFGAYWQKVDTNEWELLVNGEVVAELARDYPGRWGSVGKGWVKDRTKPVFWTLIREGAPSMKPCKDGTSLADAKMAVERILGLA